MDIASFKPKNNKADYSPEELMWLQQTGEQLAHCEQGESRTLEETRILVAYKRLQQEDNFKVVAEKPPKAVRERKPKKLTKKTFLELEIKVVAQEELSKEESDDYNHSIQFWRK